MIWTIYFFLNWWGDADRGLWLYYYFCSQKITYMCIPWRFCSRVHLALLGAGAADPAESSHSWAVWLAGALRGEQELPLAKELKWSKKKKEFRFQKINFKSTTSAFWFSAKWEEMRLELRPSLQSKNIYKHLVLNAKHFRKLTFFFFSCIWLTADFETCVCLEQHFPNHLYPPDITTRHTDETTADPQRSGALYKLRLSKTWGR